VPGTLQDAWHVAAIFRAVNKTSRLPGRWRSMTLDMVAVGVGVVLDEIAGVDVDLGGGNFVGGSCTTPAAGHPIAGTGGAGTGLQVAAVAAPAFGGTGDA